MAEQVTKIAKIDNENDRINVYANRNTDWAEKVQNDVITKALGIIIESD